MKKRLMISAAAALACMMFTACGDGNASPASTADTAKTTTASQTAETSEPESENDPVSSEAAQAHSDEQQESKIDYMTLVNKLNALPEDWETNLETETFTNTVGDEVEVEKKAYAAYLALKSDLEAEGVYVDLDSARRSVAEQQRIMNDFTKEYGADYAAKTVAAPGYSEHHTGLALDLYLIIDGKDVVLNEEMVQYPEIWKKIHAKLAENGFILRYLDNMEHITGYGYEPWHIRYIDDPAKAKEIMSEGLTLEEYLGAVKSADVAYNLTGSELFTDEELKEAAVQVKCRFAAFEGCELHSVKYAGDESSTKEEVERLSQIDEGAKYVEAVKILTDFHTPKDGSEMFDADTEIKDYEWSLAHEKDGGWQLVAYGPVNGNK